MQHSDQALALVDVSDMTNVTGGNLQTVSNSLTNAYHAGFGLRSVYRGGVKDITAVGGGWQLANGLFGTATEGATLGEKWEAIKTVKGVLDRSKRLPSWAPQW